MLIRNAVLNGYPGPVDLRLMHGAVQEIGVGLVKGLYESELDLGGTVQTLPAQGRGEWPHPSGQQGAFPAHAGGAGCCADSSAQRGLNGLNTL